ncbi:SHOCT domain-containing protein [Haladaptatus sp. NG-SE-30]
MGDTSQTLAEQIPGVVALLVLGAGLTALFLGYDWFWMVFILGFAVVLPIIAIVSEALFRKEGERKVEVSDEETDDQQDALDTLRDRYARGEIDEAEFERRVDMLLENETVEDVKARRERKEMEK